VYIEHSQLVQYFAPSFTTCQVLNTIASYEYEKHECIQQWNLFKCQTSTFYLSAYRPNLFQYLLTHASQTIWKTRLLRSLQQSSKQHIGQVFFINNAFSSTSKLLALNMYCWSFKTLVTIHWTYLRVNSIWAKSFCPWKMNNRTLFLLRDAFSGSVVIFIVYKWRYSDVIVIKLTDATKN